MNSDPTLQKKLPNIEETFAAACKDWGGRLDLATLPASNRNSFLTVQRSFQGTLDTFRRRATRKQGQPSEWYMSFVDSMDINAFADKVDRRYLIGINRGTMDRPGPAFLSTFYKMPEIMDFSRKWSDHALGTAAAVFSLDYIFLHELAHASLGHLDYLGSMGLVQRLREVDTAPAGLPIQLFHAMELQADYFAGVQLAQTIIRPEGRPLALVRKYGHDQLSLLSLAIFAVAVLGHILNESRRELDAFDNADHPHPDIRLEHFIGGLDAAIKHLQPSDLSVLPRAVKAATNGLLLAFDRLKMLEEAFPGYRKPDAFRPRLGKTGALAEVAQLWATDPPARRHASAAT